jgi:hypothetical protein
VHGWGFPEGSSVWKNFDSGVRSRFTAKTNKTRVSFRFSSKSQLFNPCLFTSREFYTSKRIGLSTAAMKKVAGYIILRLTRHLITK